MSLKELSLSTSKRSLVRNQHTVSDGGRLGFVKADHLCDLGANLNLFVELQKQKKQN